MVYKKREKKKKIKNCDCSSEGKIENVTYKVVEKKKKGRATSPFKNLLQPLLREKVVAMKFYIQLILVHVIR